MISPQNVIRHELTGLRVRVVSSSNPAQIGLSGVIVDETKNMLVIRTRRGIKNVQKHLAVFDLHLPDDTLVRVDGSVLVMAPEKRISMRVTRKR